MESVILSTGLRTLSTNGDDPSVEPISFPHFELVLKSRNLSGLLRLREDLRGFPLKLR